MSIFESNDIVSELLYYSPPVADGGSSNQGKSSSEPAIIKVDATLSIPKIKIVPSLDQVQQALNQCVECVVSVSKGVCLWSKERMSRVGLI